MKVVIDTNVVVSANLSDEGLPAAILDLAANRIILMFISPAVLAEYETVLRRPHLNLNPATVASSLAVIRNTSRLVKPTRRLTVTEDEPDNRFLECAIAAGADYIITGNTKHFPERFQNIGIVTPRQFLDLIAPELTWLR
jgi:putative PIN family toxin of toxin-antitoxin system